MVLNDSSFPMCENDVRGVDYTSYMYVKQNSYEIKIFLLIMKSTKLLFLVESCIYLKLHPTHPIPTRKKKQKKKEFLFEPAALQTRVGHDVQKHIVYS